jgi:acyl dehydratase
MTRGLFFEELEQGARFQSPGITVTEESVIRFALEWDMQPFHVDKEAAKSSIFGSLIASGLQTILLTYRLYFQLGVLDGTALAGLGIDNVRFRHPVRPGDTIRVNAEVTELRPTRQPDRGVIVWNLEAVNQDAEIVLTMTLSALIARRQ